LRRIRLGELLRVLERDEAAPAVVAGVNLTNHTAGKYDLVARRDDSVYSLAGFEK
jgi:hypothetical protein